MIKDGIFKQGIKHKASDILLSPASKPFFRIDGELTTLDELPILDADIIHNIIYKIMTQAQIKQFEQYNSLDFIFHDSDLNATFRINTVKQENGIAVACRYLSKSLPSLNDIQAPTVIKKLLKMPHGLILLTGPEGNGKTTTLAAMINEINLTQSKHIITIESPIEYTFKSQKSLIDQREATRGYNSYPGALRTALRGNPDILMIGELEDRETVRLALNAAETGQLVLSTLHASSAPTAIRRMIDFFPSSEKELVRNLIAGVLRGIISQKLVKKILGGRIAAFEILLGNNATQNLIRQNETEQLYSVMELNQQIGMCTLENSLKRLINDKIIFSDSYSEHLSETISLN